MARLGPETPLQTYTAEFGDPIYHFTDLETMKEWGPSKDESVLGKSELYYFCYAGLPYRYVAVYIDKTTRRSLVVTWKYM